MCIRDRAGGEAGNAGGVERGDLRRRKGGNVARVEGRDLLGAERADLCRRQRGNLAGAEGADLVGAQSGDGRGEMCIRDSCREVKAPICVAVSASTWSALRAAICSLDRPEMPAVPSALICTCLLYTSRCV